MPSKPLPQQQAQAAGLVYADSSQPGYTRKGCGRGFKFLDQQRQLIQGEERKRLVALVIPPAWKDVWINPDPDGHLQATGYDARGRKQYIYHPEWLEQSKRNNFDRMSAFGSVLPKLRQQARRDMHAGTGEQKAVVAMAVLMLDSGLLRIGNTAYQARNGTYGLTTLQVSHADVSDDEMVLRFVGKSGVERVVRIDDEELIAHVLQCHELGGQSLLQYEDEEGVCCELSSADVNEYLRDVSGSDITAKDFRTWGGTVAAVEFALEHAASARASEVASEDQDKDLDPNQDQGQDQSISEKILVEYVAERLGNTVAVAREHYIHPDVLSAVAQPGELSVPSMETNEDALTSAELLTLELLR